MKKLLSIMVLSVLLLGVGGAASAVGLGGDCCPVAGTNCDAGLSCSGAIVNASNPLLDTCSTMGECVAGSAGPAQTIKESCTLGSQITWKKGTINIDGSDVNCVTDTCTLGDGDEVGPLTHTSASNKTDQWGIICLMNTMTTVTNWIFYLMMVFVVVMIVIGGATYMLSAGNPEKAGKGKTMIIYGIVGLVIALIARLIPSVVKMIIGV